MSEELIIVTRDKITDEQIQSIQTLNNSIRIEYSSKNGGFYSIDCPDKERWDDVVRYCAEVNIDIELY